MTWHPASWRSFPIQQQPAYDDPQAVDEALEEVRALPPLVAPGEVDSLRAHIARAGRGECFILQGGDCAERFTDCNRRAIEAKLKILLQMSLVLTWGGGLPVVRIGRMAGQFAKPRSKDTEARDGLTLPTYRGDHVNGHDFDPLSRRPDPRRMVRAYHHAAATLNYTRALLDGGFADLRNPGHWDLGFVRAHDRRAAYQEMMEKILDALAFTSVIGVDAHSTLSTVEFFTSHEGLLLAWEEAQTEPVGNTWYNLGAHMLWIGDRTRQLDGAHVEYFRGIENPIGIKVGPSMRPDELRWLLERIEPANRPGRITLITRMGADRVEALLPPLVRAVTADGRRVTWTCDPMHGNTTTTASGIKTRLFHEVQQEIHTTFAVLQSLGQPLGGVHFELTGEDVTECLGGPQELSEDDLTRSYHTWCDPRLNYAQSLEMAFRLALHLREGRRAAPRG
jgi:3-deoxy-7-phosphoheptulonate synthase